jgi:integration host factor subunit alpha
MKLTKAALIRQVYKQNEKISKTQATESVEAFLRISKNSLINGSNLLLSGFGKFKVNDKRPRRGRNFQSGENLMLDPRRVVTFRSSPVLRDKVNGS